MSKIEQRLNTLFQEHRIIIWYDINTTSKLKKAKKVYFYDYRTAKVWR